VLCCAYLNLKKKTKILPFLALRKESSSICRKIMNGKVIIRLWHRKENWKFDEKERKISIKKRKCSIIKEKNYSQMTKWKFWHQYNKKNHIKATKLNCEIIGDKNYVHTILWSLTLMNEWICNPRKTHISCLA